MFDKINLIIYNLKEVAMDMVKKGLLIILSGPSGVGKGSIRRQLFMDESLNLTYSISMTTREARKGEIEGVDYFFVSRQEFLKEIEHGNLLEWAEFVGNLYGTPLDYVEKCRKEGKNVLLEIEVEGARQVVAKVPEAITIFLVPPSFKELEKRIRGRRSEPEEIVQMRLEKAAKEMAMHKDYRYLIKNDNLELAAKEIISIINKNSK